MSVVSDSSPHIYLSRVGGADESVARGSGLTTPSLPPQSESATQSVPPMDGPSTSKLSPVLAGVNALRFAPTRSAGFGVDTGSAPGDQAFIDGPAVSVSLTISFTALGSPIAIHPEKRSAPPQHQGQF